MSQQVLVLLPLVVLYISVHMFCECMFIMCVCVCVHVCKHYANNLDWRVLNSIEGKHLTIKYYHETYDFHHPLSLPLAAPAGLPHDPLWHSERRKHMFCCSTVHVEPSHTFTELHIVHVYMYKLHLHVHVHVHVLLMNGCWHVWKVSVYKLAKETARYWSRIRPESQ